MAKHRNLLKPPILFLITMMMMVIHLPNPALADINQRKITSTTSPSSSIDQNRCSTLVFIDYLGFRKTAGRIELNVTDIQYSNPNSNLNTSNIGFFLTTRSSHNLNVFSPPCGLHTNWSQTLFTFNNLQGNANKFDVFYQGLDDGADDYSLYFQHCLEDDYNVTQNGKISMEVRTSMYNLDAETGNRCFLSAKRVESLFKVYPVFIFIYFSLVSIWLYKYLLCNSSSMMHIAFAAVLFLKPWGLISLVIHELYIYYTGCAQCWPSNLLTFTSDFLSAAPITVLIVLICTGWSSVKPHLLPMDKGAVCFVVLANVVQNVIKIVIDQVPQQSPCVDLCGYHLMQVDIVYFVPLAAALISSIKFLRANEKPSVVVKYMLLFRSLLIAFFMHFEIEAPILVTMGTLVSQHNFASVVIKASADLFLYVYVGYQIRPVIQKEKLLPYNEDSEMEATNFLQRYDRDEFSFWCAAMDLKESMLLLVFLLVILFYILLYVYVNV